ncbi:HAMP domain-containing histidine kinase [Rossellomorea vietnamensis]|uniref:histidine kinase n=1 Tax=Rossellomorea vietnamensis TaxID=218284 RepID=A0A5D4M559_9BACI|nr:HAMP domain-containing sensor histidine kinase [Rossellomorea vietnamensis]TYR97044.1 HAMP domain-containing histidine kinase [Rossellomorea vietnamensis]
MTATSDRLALFLEENFLEFLQTWRKKVVISESDMYKEEVVNNGVRMYELVKRAISSPLSEEEIKLLARKVARERVESGVNISEFVYNVNVGRSEIIKWVSTSGIGIEELHPYFEEINRVFDRFSYFAVRFYSEIKDEQLKEKELYIDQTHKERLTILGQMSSSFVHEFRNPLTSIIGFTKLLKSDFPELPYLDVMSHELDQLNYRISQFLHVSRKEIIESKKEKFLVFTMLSELIEFLYPSLVDGDVQVKSHLDSQVYIKGNKEELRQVFLNLIMNSIDALQQVKRDRRITISCTFENEEILIRIANNGPEISEEALEAIFEPFYTTKELGTGIGLYICRKLVEKHEGSISCTSSEDETAFTVVIPAAKEELGASLLL